MYMQFIGAVKVDILCLVLNNSLHQGMKKKRKYFNANLEVWKLDMYLLKSCFARRLFLYYDGRKGEKGPYKIKTA